MRISKALRPVLLTSVALLLVPVLWVGCSGKKNANAESTTPVVGIMELAVSGRTSDPAPSNPLHVEISPDKIRLDYHTIVKLQHGKLAAADARGGIIPKLESAIRSGPARGSAAIMAHVGTPYATLVAVLATLKKNHVGEVGFEVRKGPTADTGWLVTSSYDVSAPTEQPVPFQGAAQRTWDEATAAWQQIHDACRIKDYVDCDAKPNSVAEGGQLEMTLWARGGGLKVQLTRFGGPPVDTQAKPQGPAMLDGIPQPQADSDEDEMPPATEAAFTWRARAATEDASPISGGMRNLCGTHPCGAVVKAEGQTLTARILSFIGAVYPDGTPKPVLRFEVEK